MRLEFREKFYTIYSHRFLQNVCYSGYCGFQSNCFKNVRFVPFYKSHIRTAYPGQGVES